MKPLSHLYSRHQRDDLWKALFCQGTREFRRRGAGAATVPILVEVDRYGLKAWHLRKFLKDVERFYDKHIGKGIHVGTGADIPEAVRPLPGEPLHVPDAGRHPVGEQHGGEGDPPTGRAAEDLGLVLQAVRPPVPAAAGHLADVPLPGKVVPQIGAAVKKPRMFGEFRRSRPTYISSRGRAIDGTGGPKETRETSAPVTGNRNKVRGIEPAAVWVIVSFSFSAWQASVVSQRAIPAIKV